MNQVVAQPRPLLVGGCIAKVMPHRRSPRRENCQVGAARGLECELRLHALADLVVADRWCRRRLAAGESCDLRIAKRLNVLGNGRVMPVAINDHFNPSLAMCGSVT